MSQPVNEWRERLIDEAVVCGIYSSEHEVNPKKCLQDVITWNCQVAIDPLVSSDAIKLQITTLRAAATKLKKIEVSYDSYAYKMLMEMINKLEERIQNG